MAAFEYVALNPRGRREKGVLEADSVRQVRQLLRERGLAPLQVATAADRTRKREGGGGGFSSLLQPGLSARDLALVTRQLATLIAAALPVEEALLAVAEQSESARVRTMLMGIRAKVLEGFSLANALAEYPRAFPPLFRATVAAGEAAGHLDLVLTRLADYSETRQMSRQRVQQALVYPLLLFALTVLILAGLLGYVVPDIVEVFADTGQQLPALTRGLIGSSEFVQQWGLIIIAGLVAGLLGLRQALQNEAFHRAFDRRLLRLPLIGKLSRGSNTSQFTSTLAILTSSGVPLVEAMRISAQVLSNTFLRQKVAEATVQVSEGSSLRRALDQGGHFPPMMLHMIASGESSGELDQMLVRTATHMQEDVNMLMGILLSLFGPIMLLVMGGAVFTIVMAILLPIMNMNQLVI